MTDKNTAKAVVTPYDNAASLLRGMTQRDFAALGTAEIAYMRPTLVNGEAMIAIHAADGTPIGAAPDVALAAAAIVQHEMAPARLH